MSFRREVFVNVTGSFGHRDVSRLALRRVAMDENSRRKSLGKMSQTILRCIGFHYASFPTAILSVQMEAHPTSLANKRFWRAFSLSFCQAICVFAYILLFLVSQFAISFDFVWRFV